MIETFKQRYIDYLMQTPVSLLTNRPIETAIEFLSKQNDDGSFCDICPSDDVSTASLVVLPCIRLRNIALEYKKSKDDKYLRSAILGLNWWTKHQFPSVGWYHELVSIPRMLVHILLLIGTELPKDIEKKLVERVKVTLEHDRHIHDIAANTMMLSTNKFLFALYKKDEEILKSAQKRMIEEMRFADEHSVKDKEWRRDHWKSYVRVDFKNDVYEGVQRDYSFFEHGPMLCTGAYGKIYLTHISILTYITRGTKFFPAKNIQFIIDFLLEHVKWTIINQSYDYSIAGRSFVNEEDEHSCPNPVTPARDNIVTAVENFLNLKIDYRREELVNLLENLNKGKTSARGNRYFECGKYMTQQNNRYFTSVRLSSEAVIGSECVNWQNISGWHVGDGVQYVYIDGNEYTGIFPAWNWKKLPGVTSVNNAMEPLDFQQSIHFKGSKSDYCGGVSNGKCGAAAMLLKRENLSVKKAWFMFENECVCLGTDIKTDLDYSVFTTVNQALLKGQVTTDTGEVPYGVEKKGAFKWVYHNNIGYIFPGNAEINLSCKAQTGNRYDVNRMHIPEKPKTPDNVTKDVFCLWFDHGKKAKEQSYEYRIIPGISQGKPESNAKVILNSKQMQAVECDGVIYIVFWEAGTYKHNDKEIQSDSPCIVMVEDGNITISKLKSTTRDINIIYNDGRVKTT